MNTPKLVCRVGALLTLFWVSSSARAQAIPVTVEKTDAGYRLLRGGEPYYVKGAGGTRHLELLVESGGNSIRTWGADQLEPVTWPDGRTMSLMDRAHELGLTVCAGFWIDHMPGGFKPGTLDYDDPAQVEAQLERARAFAREWKDHPALLIWGVGNEVAGDDRVRAFQELNRVAKAIKEVDPHHPTMTVLAGIWPDQAALFAQHCPDIDLLGVNAYGGLAVVPTDLLSQGYDGPYLATEYGPIGHWEVDSTPWGAEIEQPSGPKSRTYESMHRIGVTDVPDRALGGYVFLWGNKQERTDTWYSMILETGEKTAAVDAMTRVWSGREPENRAPLVEAIESDLALATVAPGSEWTASVSVTDPDGDNLSYEWVVREESSDKGAGGAFERTPGDVNGGIEDPGSATVALRVPQTPGPYRLHVYVRDGRGAVGVANVPFLVE
ncbi:MAG: glycoside hydrolase family 2 TIM barrel-domain containing protein [Planctomycetota bacterium]